MTLKSKSVPCDLNCHYPENGAWPKELGGTHVDTPSCHCDSETGYVCTLEKGHREMEEEE